jgi:hypothetical protein
MFRERDCQNDDVGLKYIPQRLGNDRGSYRPSLRRQLLGWPAARDSHVNVSTGEGMGEGLAYFSESYNCIAHNVLRSVLILIPTSDGREAAVDGQLHPIHEARIV